MPGVASGSFGLEVAKFAKLPPELITRAQTILNDLHVGNVYIPAIQRIDTKIYQNYSELSQKYNELSSYLDQKEDELQDLKIFP